MDAAAALPANAYTGGLLQLAAQLLQRAPETHGSSTSGLAGTIGV
jgi:hypothetical protein